MNKTEKMNFESFLASSRQSSEIVEAAISDNYWFDERLSQERKKGFEDIVQDCASALNTIHWDDLTCAISEYLDGNYRVPKLGIPEAFLEVNKKAWLGELDPNQTLVRLEYLRSPLKRLGLTYDALQEIFDSAESGSQDSIRALDYFLEGWNELRDGRPSFTAFYDEVLEEADSQQWPNMLRDRLGLGHYDPTNGESLPFALMMYSYQDIIDSSKQQGLKVSSALPTALDGGMHEFFFPVPEQQTYGATLYLDSGKAEILTAEIIHCRIDYKRKHLKKLGWLDKPSTMSDHLLCEIRDIHLLALQENAKRSDFGELLTGRNNHD
jgi:hypothetical protein